MPQQIRQVKSRRKRRPQEVSAKPSRARANHIPPSSLTSTLAEAVRMTQEIFRGTVNVEVVPTQSPQQNSLWCSMSGPQVKLQNFWTASANGTEESPRLYRAASKT